MRRSEFNVKDPEAIRQVLDKCDYGVVSVISGGEPYGSAVNFVWLDGDVYFHGSREGRRPEAIGRGAQASFLAVNPQAFIPSYFSDTRSACPATQFFASVHIFGTVTPVEDAAVKSEALNALMRKMQPEGGYESIAPDNPIYTKILDKMGVFRLETETVSLKVKAGQNLTADRFEAMQARLNERGGETDAATIETMKRFYDHGNS